MPVAAVDIDNSAIHTDESRGVQIRGEINFAHWKARTFPVRERGQSNGHTCAMRARLSCSIPYGNAKPLRCVLASLRNAGSLTLVVSEGILYSNQVVEDGSRFQIMLVSRGRSCCFSARTVGRQAALELGTQP